MNISIGPEHVPEDPDFEEAPNPFRTEHGRMALLVAAAWHRECSTKDQLYEPYEELRYNHTLLVARTGNILAGVALYDIKRTAAGTIHKSMLSILSVTEEYRGLGQVGPRLVQATMALAQEHGAEYVDLRCNEERLPFYTRQGFQCRQWDSGLYLLRREV